MTTLQKIAAVANVKVVCRFRPINQRQKALGASHVHQLFDTVSVTIKTPQIKDPKDRPKFNYDRVFDVESTQKQVYQYAASSVVDSVIQGFNGTIFAYGQTSSGKTHTMQGEVSKQVTQNSGIIPRMIEHVFHSISNFSQKIQFRIKVSLVQLYMQKLRDLIDLNKNDLKIRSDKKRGVFIQDLTQTYISSSDQVFQLIQKAQNNRAIAATNMNQNSSRSHLIFIISISQNNLDDLSAKTGKLYLVDLAGSQKVGKTGAEGKTLDQAKKINTSLAALGKVINALTDGKSTHVPYRDSKLTRVLQQSLGGNSKTTLIVTCSPHPNNVAQTLSTLRFGISAKKIKNCPKINKELTVAQLQNLLQKIQKQASQKQKYILQLKDHIINDLKQKSIPQFKADGTTVDEVQKEQNDLLGQLQRQLQMQRNRHLVLQEEIQSLKNKSDQLSIDKEQLQKEIEILKQRQIGKKTSKNQSQKTNNLIIMNYDKKRLIQQLKALTNDQDILNLVSNSDISEPNTNEKSLLAEYQQEKEKRKKAEDQMQKYQKNMQKKLMQLQNNICQLTHAYYDLIAVQQGYKVDNIFLKKKLQQKDVVIRTLKGRIKDLQDQNRQLEQQWTQDDSLKILKQNRKLMKEVQQSNRMFDEALQKKNINNKYQAQSLVVKVLKGGQK